VVPEDLAARVVAEATQEVPGAPEVDRVDPAVVQAARVVAEATQEVPEDLAARVVAEVTQEVPAVPEVDRVDPAGTNDPAVSACGLPGINN
jgi:hypothetical protein